MRKEDYKFFAEDFWRLIEMQEYKCAMTGRELTPSNCEVELKEPYKDKGRGDFENHYMVDKRVSYIGRYLSEEEIVELAAEIIRYRGKEFGYGLRKSKKA